MLLCELFDDGTTTMDKLRHDVLDVIAPLLNHKVPFVTVQQVIDQLKKTQTGMAIDRALVLDLLDPSKVEVVSKIEGDKIIFAGPTDDEERDSEDEQKRQDDKVRSTAIDQAKQAAIANNRPAPQPPAPPPPPTPTA